MEREDFLNEIKDILVNWCNERMSNIGDIKYEQRFSSGKTHIRFTNDNLEKIMPSLHSRKGSWGCGYPIFHEFNNRDKKLKLSLVIGSKHLTADEKEYLKFLAKSVGKELKDNWEYKFLNGWDIYKYNENEPMELVRKKIISEMDRLYESEIKIFEEKLLDILQDAAS
ncbi:MAG: hypothetical protein ACRC7N_03240 [Clostridium sp.]